MACQYDSHSVTSADCSASYEGDQQDRVRWLPWLIYVPSLWLRYTLPARRLTGRSCSNGVYKHFYEDISCLLIDIHLAPQM